MKCPDHGSEVKNDETCIAYVSHGFMLEMMGKSHNELDTMKGDDHRGSKCVFSVNACRHSVSLRKKHANYQLKLLQKKMRDILTFQLLILLCSILGSCQFGKRCTEDCHASQFRIQVTNVYRSIGSPQTFEPNHILVMAYGPMATSVDPLKLLGTCFRKRSYLRSNNLRCPCIVLKKTFNFLP